MVSNHMPNAWRVLSGLLKKHHHKVVDLAVAKLPSSYIMLHSCYIKIPPGFKPPFRQVRGCFFGAEKTGCSLPKTVLVDDEKHPHLQGRSSRKPKAGQAGWLKKGGHSLMIHSFGDNLGIWIVFGLSMIEYFGIRISYNKLDTLKLLIFTKGLVDRGG
jgi:hypothetical protein